MTAHPLAGKRALVTGATSGIGAAMAHEMWSAGADIARRTRYAFPAGDLPKDEAVQVYIKSTGEISDRATPSWWLAGGGALVS